MSQILSVERFQEKEDESGLGAGEQTESQLVANDDNEDKTTDDKKTQEKNDENKEEEDDRNEEKINQQPQIDQVAGEPIRV